jgi:hypothetical protein
MQTQKERNDEAYRAATTKFETHRKSCLSCKCNAFSASKKVLNVTVPMKTETRTEFRSVCIAAVTSCAFPDVNLCFLHHSSSALSISPRFVFPERSAIALYNNNTRPDTDNETISNADAVIHEQFESENPNLIRRIIPNYLFIFIF